VERCEKCGQTGEGDQFAIMYGKRVAQRAEGDRTVIVYHIANSAPHRSFICSRCQTERKLKLLRNPNPLLLPLLASIGGFAVASIPVVLIRTGNELPDFIMVLLFGLAAGAFFFLGIGGFFAFLGSLTERVQYVRERGLAKRRPRHILSAEEGYALALELNRERLKAQGYDSFFGPKEYQRLLKQNLTRRG
jgi:hypothetical protein